jgi:acyl-CoA thioesterase I
MQLKLSRVPFLIMLAATAPLLLGSNSSEPAAATAAAASTSPLSSVIVELGRKWPKSRTVNIVCHGHSVPAGYFRTPNVRPLDSYPHLLRVGLSERFPTSVCNVIVTAIGGEHAEKGAARFQADVLSLRPDVVTIDYALNDRSIGLERAERAWRTMIEACVAQKIPVILLTPTADSKANLADPEDPLNQHAGQIRRLAAEYKLLLVDSLAAFQRHVAEGGKFDDLLSQNNHPNRRGHELVAQELLKLFQ